MLTIPLLVAVSLAAVALAMTTAGAKIKLADPLAAGFVAAAAGVMGVAPIVRAGRKDAMTSFQFALVGTVLHMVGAIGLTVFLVGTGAIDGHGAFGYWLVGGYWISLLGLVWQLRRMIVAAVPAAK